MASLSGRLERALRSHLLDPTANDPRLSTALALGREIYALYEAGADYDAPLRQLGVLVGRPIHGFAVRDGFGSVGPDIFARRQLVAWDQPPSDVTEEEMLEMVDGVCGVTSADELQRDYWLACLQVCTGDRKIRDLIFFPGDYFGDGDDARLMSSSEILETALRAGGRPR